MTVSAERIKKAALLRFALQGYDATALAEIAGDVGIKTPSIYAHFPGKQALFLDILESVFNAEIAEIEACLRRPEPVRASMRAYLHETIVRFDTAPSLRFWLRTIYLPPSKMTADISAYDRRFSALLEETVSRALRQPNHGLRRPALPHETLALAFIGILRGLHAELLYSSSAESARVLAALWTVFERSLTAEA